jgi:NDP-sugar pyrophosphorylase family protein
MKVVILAGGLGTRISEETHLKPKPMIEIGRRPILWHIMKRYSVYNANDFVNYQETLATPSRKTLPQRWSRPDRFEYDVALPSQCWS